jgi:poly-gamma-glutamate synthesis protein (capsule biosynthesis protein)
MSGRIRLALGGDTMLGRGVGAELLRHPDRPLFSPDLAEIIGEADLFVINLECCISERGERWPDPAKPFFFRAPPLAIDQLLAVGVDCVTLANNHALDYGIVALVDTLDLLADAGIAVVGAGLSAEEARSSTVMEHHGFRLRVIGLTDHPSEYAAGPDRPGVAYADLTTGVPRWVLDQFASDDADATLVTPHWGPNMTSRPVSRVRRAATILTEAGACLVAGHSAHVFHGVQGNVFFDLGDLIDDYAVDERLRNDLGLLFIVDLDRTGPRRLETVPIALDYAFTRLATADEGDWIRARFRSACAELGVAVEVVDGRCVVEWDRPSARGFRQHDSPAV